MIILRNAADPDNRFNTVDFSRHFEDRFTAYCYKCIFPFYKYAHCILQFKIQEEKRKITLQLMSPILVIEIRATTW